MGHRLIESLRCVGDDGAEYVIDVYQQFHPGDIPGLKRLALRGNARTEIRRIDEATFQIMQNDLIVRVARD